MLRLILLVHAAGSLTGCSVLIHTAGVSINDLETRAEVHAAFGQPVSVDDSPSNQFVLQKTGTEHHYNVETFHTRRKISHGVGGVSPILAEPLATWEALSTLADDVIDGHEYHFAFDEDGNVIGFTPRPFFSQRKDFGVIGLENFYKSEFWSPSAV